MTRIPNKLPSPPESDGGNYQVEPEPLESTARISRSSAEIKARMGIENLISAQVKNGDEAEIYKAALILMELKNAIN